MLRPSYRAIFRQITENRQSIDLIKYRFLSTIGGEKRGDIETCYKKLDLSFENTEEAFKSKTNWQLWRALVVLKLCSYKFIVEQNLQLMQLAKKLLGKKLFAKLMKATVYGHFVAGEDQDEIKPTVQRMKAFGVKSILDYSVEADVEPAKDEEIGGIHDRGENVISARTYYYEGEPECDKTMEIFRSGIDSVVDYTDRSGFAVIKVTALGRPQLLLRLSDVIAKAQNFYKVLSGSSSATLLDSKMTENQIVERLKELGIKADLKELSEWFAECDKNKDGHVDLYEWKRVLDSKMRLSKIFKAVNLTTGKIESLIPDLTDKEQTQFENLIKRLNFLARYASEKDVRMMIDAEQTYLQPAISRLTLELMRRYNKEKAVIFNTYQAYLRTTLTNVKIDLHMARKEDFYFGAKLVRGAYMVQERQRAEAMGYPDPINPNFDTTTEMYKNIFMTVMDEAKSRPAGKVSVMCATHNEDTIRHVLKIMLDKGIGPAQRMVCFGQLYGMCDPVSFSLGQAGFSVYKYVPYGPVEGVMPYLSRRVQENSGLIAKSQRERALILKEIKRRYKKLKLVHSPTVVVAQ